MIVNFLCQEFFKIYNILQNYKNMTSLYCQNDVTFQPVHCAKKQKMMLFFKHHFKYAKANYLLFFAFFFSSFFARFACFLSFFNFFFNALP